MSELSYKELQEQGVFDVPYRAFEFMQSQQAKIDELQSRVDEALRFYNEAKSPHNIGMIQMAIYLKGNKDESIREL